VSVCRRIAAGLAFVTPHSEHRDAPYVQAMVAHAPTVVGWKPGGGGDGSPPKYQQPTHEASAGKGVPW